MKNISIIIMVIAMWAGMTFANQAFFENNVSQNDVLLSKDLDLTGAYKAKLNAMADQLALDAKSAYWLSDYQLAADLYHLLLKSGKSDYNDIYNLACCYSRLGKVKLAARYLCLSVEEGFNDIGHIMNDPDFENIRETPCFQKAIKRAGQQISRRMEERNRTSVKLADLFVPK